MDPPSTATDVKDLVATQIRVLQKIIRDQQDYLYKLEIVAKELASLERAIERGIFEK